MYAEHLEYDRDSLKRIERMFQDYSDEEMERIIFTHTTTIGLRKHPVERTVLDRRQETVDTAFGPAKVKICRYENQTFFYPEYESVREICRGRDIPFGDVCREITEAAVREFAGERE